MDLLQQLGMDACDPDGSRHRWKYTLHGDTENVILWGENLLADLTSHGYRIYPATQEGPADVYKDGVSVRECKTSLFPPVDPVSS